MRNHVSLKAFVVLAISMVTGCQEMGVRVETGDATGITYNTATLNGSVEDLEGSTADRHGFAYAKTEHPTVDNNLKVELGEKGSGGEFNAAIAGLRSNTTYWFRAFAEVSGEITYGEQRSFTTLRVDAPVLAIDSIAEITLSSVKIAVTVISDGGAGVVARGVCLGTTQNPTLINSHTEDGTGTGSFTSGFSGLECGTTYYVRAYATNNATTAYSTQVNFATLDCPPGPPGVSTRGVSSTTRTSTVSGGNVSGDGGAPVSARGVCWSTLPDPTVADDHTTDGSGTGNFTSQVTGLTTGTTYYIRAYAVNSLGTGYGNTVSFTTRADPVTDHDGNVYETVIIGEQTWMAENLKVTHYADGTAIEYVPDTVDWEYLASREKAYSYYANDSAFGDTYGYLYTSAAARNGLSDIESNPSGIQGVCPDGWHIPSDAEWIQLEVVLGMDPSTATRMDWRGSPVGNRLKATEAEHWNTEEGTNTSGFTGLGAGYRNTAGAYMNLYDRAYFWSATAGGDDRYCFVRILGATEPGVGRFRYSVDSHGCSVRCVKDPAN